MRSIFLATIILSLSFFALGKWVTGTQTWFFWRTGMAKINFMDKWKGYAIHGAYWHLRFGHPISHGCINVTLKDMEQLYAWFDSLAIPIHIYGETPRT